jgi:chitinase
VEDLIFSIKLSIIRKRESIERKKERKENKMNIKMMTITVMLMSAAFAMYGYDAWDSGKTYSTTGTLVEHGGKVWKNSWWTKGENPELSGQWGVWKVVENTVTDPDPVIDPTPDPAPVTTGTWDQSTIYNSGDTVAYNGKTYKAGWWTQGESPELSGQWGVWKVVENTLPDPDPVVDPTPDPDPVTDPDPIPDPVVNPVNHDKRVAGYFAEWGIYGRNYQVTDIPVEDITHINYAFLNIKNGKAVIGDNYAAVEKHFSEVIKDYGTFPKDDWDGLKSYYGNLNRLNRLDELVNEYYGKDIKLMFSIGGWTWSENFPEVTKDAASREVFVQSIVDNLRKYKFEGVSFDWEYPVLGPQNSYKSNPKLEENDNLIAMLKTTREAFDDLEQETGTYYEITIALSGAPSTLKYLDMKTVSEYCDNLDIMTYDYTAVAWGNSACHQSPIYNNPNNPDLVTSPELEEWNVNGVVQYLIDQGVERGKILVGIPIYGRSGNDISYLFQEGGTAGKGTWENGVYDYSSIMGVSDKLNVSDTNPAYYHFDEIAQASYYLNPETQEFISFDNLDAVKAKCDYVKEQDLGGVMFWEFSGDAMNNPELSIIKTITKEFSE